MALALKDARLEFKTTTEAKDLLFKAASLSGVDVTAFVLTSSIDRARQVLAEHNALSLSQNAQNVLAELLNGNPVPTVEMKKLMSLPQLPEA